MCPRKRESAEKKCRYTSGVGYMGGQSFYPAALRWGGKVSALNNVRKYNATEGVFLEQRMEGLSYGGRLLLAGGYWMVIEFVDTFT